MNIQRVLCVCTGNICRSPLAEGLLRRDLSTIQTSSAGIGAVSGGQMPTEAAEIARREHLPNAEDHRGQQITSPLMRNADVVLVMEDEHLQWVTSQFPESRGRVFKVTHWGEGRDIDDPYRRGRDAFEQAYREIEAGLRQWQERLVAAG